MKPTEVGRARARLRVTFYILRKRYFCANTNVLCTTADAFPCRTKKLKNTERGWVRLASEERREGERAIRARSFHLYIARLRILRCKCRERMSFHRWADEIPDDICHRRFIVISLDMSDVLIDILLIALWSLSEFQHFILLNQSHNFSCKITHNITGNLEIIKLSNVKKYMVKSLVLCNKKKKKTSDGFNANVSVIAAYRRINDGERLRQSTQKRIVRISEKERFDRLTGIIVSMSGNIAGGWVNRISSGVRDLF